MCAFIRGVLLLIAGVAAQLALTVIGVVGLIPALRGPARWVQRALIGSVGDSFAHLYDEATWRRIERRLTDTIEYLSPRADLIAVVTHSQGTAVLHRPLVDRRMPDRVAAWVSLGSGLQKLISLRGTRTRALVGWAALRAAALGFFLASMPFWSMVTDPANGRGCSDRHHRRRIDGRRRGPGRALRQRQAVAAAGGTNCPRAVAAALPASLA
jgi:hypothetical protein